LEEDKIVLRIQLSRDEYERLKRIAEERGYSLVSDLVKAVLEGLVPGSPGAGQARGVEQELRRLERRITDLLNPYTGKIDEIMRRLGELQEMLEECLGREERPSVEAPRPQARPAQARPRSQWREERYERPRRQYKSGIERLRTEKVVTGSDVKWMRMPDKFFDKLRREGAVVFRAGGETIAVDPDFWDEFISLLSRYSVRDHEELAGILEEEMGEKAARLFRMLLRSGLVYYDEETGGWMIEAPR